MKTNLLIFLFGIMWHSAFCCSCVDITNACDYLNSEYTIPVVVSFKNLSTHEATLQIEKILSDDIILNDTYHIFGDTVTSCNRSLESVVEGTLYYFGFPIHNISEDTIGYYQCMSPFYNAAAHRKLSSCSSHLPIQAINVYPNPIQGNIFFISQQIENLSSLTIYNFNGQCVFQKDLVDATNDFFTLPEELNSGMYVVILQTDRGLKYQSKLFL